MTMDMLTKCYRMAFGHLMCLVSDGVHALPATRPALTDRGRDLPPRFRRVNRFQGHVSIDEFSNRYSPLIEEVD